MMGRACAGSGSSGSGFVRRAACVRIAAALFVVVALAASAFLFVPQAFAPESTTEPAVTAAVYCSSRG